MSIATSEAPSEPVQRVLSKVTVLATLPEITARIIATVESPRSTARELHAIIAHDPALVTRILKVVNSAFYGLPGQIGSVDRAIVLLGLNAVKNIAVAASLGQLFRGGLGQGFTAKDLWLHCIAVGVAAREMARHLKLPLGEEAFLAGMIHDVGVLALMQAMPQPYAQVCQLAQSSDDNFLELERRVLGMDHQQVGAAITAAWRFPRSCQLVAGYHHRPADLADNYRLLATLVFAAEVLCCERGKGFCLTGRGHHLDEARLSEIPFDPAVVDRAGAALDEQLAVASALLS